MTRERCTTLQAYVEAGRSQMILHPLSEDIVLAGQPQPDDWARLLESGFDLVINMRSDPERAVVQAQNAQAAGLNYLHLPLPAYELEAEHIAYFYNLLQKQAGRKLFIHCRTASRVGLIWLLMRITHYGWTQAEAEAELTEAGYDADDLETFDFCASDYLERAVELVAQ